MTRRDFASSFSGSVLRRDATSTDYIVIPLFAGFAARLIPAVSIAFGWREPPNQPIDLEIEAARLLARCDAAEDDQWKVDVARYAEVGNFLLKAWVAVDVVARIPPFALSAAYGSGDKPPAEIDPVGWLRANPEAPLLDALLVAAFGAEQASGDGDELPIQTREARRIRVELANRLRKSGLTSWPALVRAGAEAWTLEAASVHAVHATDLLDITTLAMAEDRLHRSHQAFPGEMPAEMPDERAASDATNDERDLRAIEEVEARLETKSQQVSVLRNELASRNDQLARRDSRIETLEKELADTERRIKRLRCSAIFCRTGRGGARALGLCHSHGPERRGRREAPLPVWDAGNTFSNQRVDNIGVPQWPPQPRAV